MKSIVLIFGVLLLALNTFAGLIISAYQPFNYLMADLSIVITMVIILWFSSSNVSSAMKIGLSTLFPITGLARTVCMMLMPSTLENNIVLLVAAGILVLELTCVVAAKFADSN